MGKRQFTAEERYAVYTVHGEKCHLCTRPIDLASMQVDHVLPEHLLDTPERLSATLDGFGLPSDFDLNSFANWLPACAPCNIIKRGQIFRPAPIMLAQIDKARSKASEAQQFAEAIVADQSVGKALNLLERVSTANPLGQEAREALHRITLYHLVNRNDSLAREPIRLTPEHSAYLEVQFSGGPQHGKIVTSGDPQLHPIASRFLLAPVLALIGQSMEDGRKRDNYLTWKAPVPEVVALANEEGWSPEERQKRLRYHVYHVFDYEFTDTAIVLKAKYRGVEA